MTGIHSDKRGIVLFLILLIIPIVEIALFIQVGGAIGLLPTLAIVVLTAVLGSTMIRAQGLRTWMQARASLDRGEMPVHELFDGLCIFAAGIMLVTPGFFTDALGVLLLLPPIRHLLSERLVRSMVVIRGGRTERQQERRHPVIIETEFHEVREEDPEEDRPPRG